VQFFTNFVEEVKPEVVCFPPSLGVTLPLSLLHDKAIIIG